VVKTITSKQDRPRARTAADIEQKYNFGQTFAEVFNLITDAQKAADEAKAAIDNLDHEQIFNLLTDNGRIQGVYRGDDGNVYINATYIKSGKLAAEYIDGTNLTIKNGAFVGGTMNVNDKFVVDENGNVTLKGSITWGADGPPKGDKGDKGDTGPQGPQGPQGDDGDPEAYLQSIGITSIDSGSVKSPRIEGGQILGAEIYGGFFADLEADNFLKIETTTTESTGMVHHKLAHYVGDADSQYPLTAMGWASVSGKDMWYLMVLGSYILTNDYSGSAFGRVTRVKGTWDFSEATVIGLNPLS
jgi:hypothetical protein